MASFRYLCSFLINWKPGKNRNQGCCSYQAFEIPQRAVERT